MFKTLSFIKVEKRIAKEIKITKMIIIIIIFTTSETIIFLSHFLLLP